MPPGALQKARLKCPLHGRLSFVVSSKRERLMKAAPSVKENTGLSTQAGIGPEAPRKSRLSGRVPARAPWPGRVLALARVENRAYRDPEISAKKSLAGPWTPC